MNYLVIKGAVKKYILLLLFQTLIFCKGPMVSENSRTVHEWMGEEIFFPDKVSGDPRDKPINDNLKIVTRINGNCYPCLSQLKYWTKLIDEITSKFSVSFYIFIVANDYEIFNLINEKEMHFDYPVVYDHNDEFSKINRLPQNDIFHTMLLTRDNKIILIGNPIHNNVLKDLYIKEILKHQSDR